MDKHIPKFPYTQTRHTADSIETMIILTSHCKQTSLKCNYEKDFVH